MAVRSRASSVGVVIAVTLALFAVGAGRAGGASTRVCGVKFVDQGHVVAAVGCWVGTGEQWRSTGRVSVDGLRLRRGSIDIDQSAQTLRSEGSVSWSLGRVRLGRWPLEWSPGTPPIRVSLPGGLRGLRFSGPASVTFVAQDGGETLLHAGVVVPLVPGGLAGDVVLQASRRHQFRIRKVRIAIGQARVGHLRFSDVSLTYTRPAAGLDRWTGHAELSLPVFRAPRTGSPGTDALEASVRLDNRVLKRLAVKLKGLDLDVGEGFFLQTVSVSVAPSPLAIGGGASATFGPQSGSLLDVSGRLHYWSAPDRWVASGAVGLPSHLPGFHKLANAKVTVRPGQSIAVHGAAGFKVHGWGLSTTVDGFASTDAFNFEGKAKLSLPGFGLHGDALVSSNGLAACGGIKLLFAHYRVGFGYRWHGGLTIMHGSCDIGPWRAPVHALRAGGGIQPVTQGTEIYVPSGPTFELFSAQGADVRLTTPDGAVFTTLRNANTPSLFVTHDPKTKTAYIAIPIKTAGIYRIDGLTATPTAVRAADGLPEPSISAGVTGTGPTRTLGYTVDFAGVPDESVDFYESTSPTIVGATLVGSVTSGPSATNPSPGQTIDFDPEPLGPSGRYVYAVVSNGPLVREIDRVATFDFEPIPLLPAPPAQIRVSPDGATVNWKAGGVAAWELLIDEDGASKLLTLDGKTLSQFIPDQTAAKLPLQVELTPIDKWGRLGATTLCNSLKPGRCVTQ